MFRDALLAIEIGCVNESLSDYWVWDYDLLTNILSSVMGNN
jgi:hypothetical protein